MKRGPREYYYYFITKRTLEELMEEFSEETKGREVKQLNVDFVRGRYELSAVLEDKKDLRNRLRRG